MRIPKTFIPDKDLDIKIEELKQEPLSAGGLSKLEEEISKLRSELKECEDRRIKNPDYYSVLMDPYREEREVRSKLIQLELNYIEKNGSTNN